MNAVNGKLPAKTLVLWRIRATAVFLLLCGVFTPFFCALLPFIMFIYLTAVLWYLPRLHKSFFCETTKNRVYLRYGAILGRHKLLILKENAVVISFSTPLCRMLRLESIAIKMPRGWLVLPESERGGWQQNV